MLNIGTSLVGFGPSHAALMAAWRREVARVAALIISGGSANGGTITDVNGYRIHTFTSSESLIVTGTITDAEILIVAGGGGGGKQGRGGGGGAGGVIRLTGQTLSAGTKAVVVGAGGAGATSNTGSDGDNSSFNGSTAIGGGGGGGGGATDSRRNGRAGGSGGGASTWNGSGTAGAGTAGQGSNGGTGTEAGPDYGAGGGGGASAVGVNGTSSKGGNGGAGVSYDTSGSSVTYAGGGGGAAYQNNGNIGLGGAGGGGNGGTWGGGLAPTAGTANRGGGGGGGDDTHNGAAGGSGVVIIKYLLPIATLVSNWQTQVTAAGGTYDSYSTELATNLLSGIYNSTYSSKIKYFLPLIGTNLSGSLTPLIDRFGTGNPINTSFADADFTQSGGLQGNGSSKLLTTRIKPSQLGSSNNGGMGFIELTTGANGGTSPVAMGCVTATPQYFRLITKGGSAEKRMDWGTSTNGVSVVSAPYGGHFYMQRSSGTSRELYQTGNLIGSNTTNDTASEASVENIIVMGDNFGGARYYAGRCGGMYLTDGTMTTGEIAAFNGLLYTGLILARSLDTDTIAYRNRVLADSGTVHDIEWVNQCVVAAKSGGWWDSVRHWTSASFGRKLSGTSVDKLYCLKSSDAAQTSSSNRPVWNATGTFSGSVFRPVVTYDGTDDYITIGGTGLADNPAQLTVALVANSTIDPANAGVLYGHRSESNRLIQVTAQGNTDVRLQMRGSAASLQAIVVNNAFTSTHELLLAKFDKTNDSHSLQRNAGTAEVSTYDFGSETFTSTVRTIGGANNGAFTNPHKGNIAETLVLESTLTSPQASGVRNLFKTKYNLY